MVQQEQPQGETGPEQPQRDPEIKGSNKVAEGERVDETEQTEHDPTHGKWGQLPEYMEFLKTRGGQPDVPERYRRYRDAFLKQSQKQQSK